MILARLCRTAAIVLALIGAIDPAVPRARTAKPVVSLLRTSGSSAFGDSVAAALTARADVVNGLTADATAVVVAGDRLPDGAARIHVPAFVVWPPAPSVAMSDLSVPARTHLDARVSVTASVHVRGARGQTLSVALTTNGVTLDQVERPVPDDDVRVTAPLTFVPSTPGAAALRVTARLGSQTSSADALITVDARPWSVFVFDRRPSWMSTFVRRAMEDDNRFAVTTRTVTSRGVATDTPNAPVDLGAPVLSRFDVIVIGAPDALTAGDVAGLDAFMRRRAGSVLLLWDVRPVGPALSLMGVDRWTHDTRAADRSVVMPSGAIRASDVSWPTTLPARATAVGRIVDANASASSTAPPVLWAAPVGAGELVVSGALDSWRYRALALAAFDTAWRRVIADAAASAPAAMTVTVSPAVVAPGQHLNVSTDVRDVELSPAPPATSMTWRIESSGGAASTVGRAWPADAPGRFSGDVQAPTTPGRYRMVASDGTNESGADFVVDATAAAPAGDDTDALAAWAASRGGRVGSAVEIAGAIPPVDITSAPTRPWHPMRSGWWIAPITLLLGIEWWTRRRTGLR